MPFGAVALEFDGENIWAAHYEVAGVTKYSRFGNRVGFYEVEPEPISMKFDGENMWVASFTQNNLPKLTRDGRLLGKFPTGHSPGGMYV
ncbi:MAG: hypothetical protein HY682_07160, partial [Chloroflexi bacterium]|nr:hypothetical protein [Chloroflexota bacterium]